MERDHLIHAEHVEKGVGLIIGSASNALRLRLPRIEKRAREAYKRVLDELQQVRTPY